MATFLNLLGGAIQGVKKATGLSGVNLIPGDISQKTTNVPANIAYNATRSANPIDTRITYTTPKYGPQMGQVLPASTSVPQQAQGGTGTGAQNTNQVPAGTDILRNDINRQTEDFGSIIDRDYETVMSNFGMQEEGLRSQAGTSQQSIEAGYAPARTAIQEKQASEGQKLSEQEATAKTQEKSALQQARDLFKQIQQENIAQLAGAGLTSSSVNEALAERLGVETARRIAGVTGSTQEIVNNIAKERTNLERFTKQKLADLETEKAARTAEIQNSLMQGINQINQARQLASTDKANRRAELLSNAQTQIAQINAKTQEFQQSLQEWNAKRAASLAEANAFVISPTNTTGLTNAINQISQLPSVGGFQPVPNIQWTNAGLKISPTYQKKNEDATNSDLSF